MKPFQASGGRGKEYHFESRTEEKRSHGVIKNSKSHAEDGQSINSSGIPNLVLKRKESYSKKVIKSPRTLGLVRKRVRVLIHEKFQTSHRRGKEYLLKYFESRAEENLNYKSIRKF